MTQAMVMLRDGTLAKVAVYRDGNTVTVRGMGEQDTPGGKIQVAVEAQMPVAAFEFIRRKAIEKVGTLVYTRMIGRLGIDDNVMRAPPLPRLPAAPVQPHYPRSPFALPPRR